MNDVPVVSPSCSLIAPCCRWISYFAGLPAAAGQVIVAVRSVMSPAAGVPGAAGTGAARAGRRVSRVSE